MSEDSSLPIGHPVSITLVNGAVRTGVVFTYEPEDNALVLLTPSNNNNITNNNKDNNSNNNNNSNTNTSQWGFTVLNTTFIKSVARPPSSSSLASLTLPPSLAAGVVLPHLPTEDKKLITKMKENIDKAINMRSRAMPPRENNNNNNNTNNTNNNNDENNGNNNNNNNNNNNATMPVLALALYLQLSRTLLLSRWDSAEEVILVSSTPGSLIYHDDHWRPTQPPKLKWKTKEPADGARQRQMVEGAWNKVCAQCDWLGQENK